MAYKFDKIYDSGGGGGGGGENIELDTTLTQSGKAADSKAVGDAIAKINSGTVQDEIPYYWVNELKIKADAIQAAMEKAGRNKSAFLWYTDAHWDSGNSGSSPKLLNYLYKNTSMNKVNFGGDIIGSSLPESRDTTSGYLREWRSAIKDLPNHHSVLGNHDRFKSYSYADDNYRYAFMFAPEETPDIVWGNDGYYYIDNPHEKTRYLYLTYPVIPSDSSATDVLMKAQGKFITETLQSTPEGWHIVIIAHRWWSYIRDTNGILDVANGRFEPYEAELLRVFDAYNARETSHTNSNYVSTQSMQGFNNAKGKIEFCIGGHIHADYNFTSNSGIPVILTTSDVNQERTEYEEEDYGKPNTIYESAVYGIIADYNDPDNTKITVVGVGRGGSRTVYEHDIEIKSILSVKYIGDTTVGTSINTKDFELEVEDVAGKQYTIFGVTSVTPVTIENVGDNPVTVTYETGTTELTASITIQGTEVPDEPDVPDVPSANLFNKGDGDVKLNHRIKGAGTTENFAAGQLVTGFIEGKSGDTFTITTDKNLKTNSYTGMVACYKDDKTHLTANIGNDSNTCWTFSADGKTGTVTIPTKIYNSNDYSETGLVRFCIAYTDINNIVITKA